MAKVQLKNHRLSQRYEEAAMKIKSREDNLILQSFLTVEFLEALYGDKFLETEYGLSLLSKKVIRPEFKEIGIGNQGSFLMLLYALLVIPKELVGEKYFVQYEGINEWLSTNALELESTYEKKGNHIKHIRNAVAHAKVCFEPNCWVKFTDNYKSATFKIKLSLRSLDEFIYKLKEVHNKYIEENS